MQIFQIQLKLINSILKLGISILVEIHYLKTLRKQQGKIL